MKNIIFRLREVLKMLELLKVDFKRVLRDKLAVRKINPLVGIGAERLEDFLLEAQIEQGHLHCSWVCVLSSYECDVHSLVG